MANLRTILESTTRLHKKEVTVRNLKKLLILFVIVITGLYVTTNCFAAGLTVGFGGGQSVDPIVIDDIDWGEPDGIPDPVSDDPATENIYWTPFGEGNSIYFNGSAIKANGSKSGFAGATWKIGMPAKIPCPASLFRLSVEFDSTECISESVMGVAIANASTDRDQFNEYIAIVNGHDTQNGMTSRSWGALSFKDGELIDSKIEETTDTSGSFHILHRGSMLHVGYNWPGLEGENALASFSIEDWTACDEVIIKLFGWSDKQVLSGNGSYFGNTFFEHATSTDVDELEDCGDDKKCFDTSGKWIGKSKNGNTYEITITDIEISQGPFYPLSASTPFGEYAGLIGENREVRLIGPAEDTGEVEWHLYLSEDGTELTGTITDIIDGERTDGGNISFIKKSVFDAQNPVPAGDGDGGSGCYISTVK